MAGCNGTKPIADFVYETYVARGEIDPYELVDREYLNLDDAKKVAETFEDGKYDIMDRGDFHRMGDGACHRDWLGRWVMRKDFEALIALGSLPAQKRIESLIKTISDEKKSPVEVENAIKGLLAIHQFDRQIPSDLFGDSFFIGLCRYPSLYQTLIC